eukprot:3280695-Pyramimonas_sp.AAC.2
MVNEAKAILRHKHKDDTTISRQQTRIDDYRQVIKELKADMRTKDRKIAVQSKTITKQKIQLDKVKTTAKDKSDTVAHVTTALIQTVAQLVSRDTKSVREDFHKQAWGNDWDKPLDPQDRQMRIRPRRSSEMRPMTLLAKYVPPSQRQQ